MAVEQETAFPAVGRATLATCPPSAKLHLSPSRDLGPDLQQAPGSLPSAFVPLLNILCPPSAFSGL